MFLRLFTCIIIGTAAVDIKPDIDPCEGKTFCGNKGDCTVLADSSLGCKCRDGYGTIDNRTCTNIDECSSGISSCAPYEEGGYCVDTDPTDGDPTDGEFPKWKCGCRHEDGFKDGAKFDEHGPTECAYGCAAACGLNSRCSHVDDEAYECVCNEGYQSDDYGNCISARNMLLPSSMPSTSSRPSQKPVGNVLPSECYQADTMNVTYSNNFASDDSLWSNAKYAENTELGRFMGPFKQGDKVPSRIITIPPGLTRVIISFDAIELDSWDGSGVNGPDELIVKVESIVGTTEVKQSFMYWLTEDNVSGGDDTYSYSVITASTRQSLGGSPTIADQLHHVTITLGHSKFSPLGEDLKLTIGFNFAGEKDESLGIDNVELKSCITTLQTPVPTPAPTTSAPTTSAPTTSSPTTSSPTTSAPTQTPRNVAIRGSASQSSTYEGAIASRAIDGNSNGDWGQQSMSHTDHGDRYPWWKVDLQNDTEITKIVVWNRVDAVTERLSDAEIVLLKGGVQVANFFTQDSTNVRKFEFEVNGIVADSVEVLASYEYLTLAEVEVFGLD